jgi:zinc protease
MPPTRGADRKTLMTDLHWTETDGVATVWADVPGPLRAELLFRTGVADETAVTRGLTHLIEHLVLSAIDDPTGHRNGFVGHALTGFNVSGDPDAVAASLLRICRGLASLPADRLGAEKQVLEAEDAARSNDLGTDLMTWRFGATGFGLGGLSELGVRSATIEQLRDFAAPRFTRGNAVLWLTGPPPPGLRLELPQGERRPLPPLEPLRQMLPGWYVDDATGGIALGSLVPRNSTSSVFRQIAHNRLRDLLRTERALSYAPAVLYEPLDAHTAHLVLCADSDLHRREELAEAFGEVFVGLTHFDEAEVAAAKEQLFDYWTGSQAVPPQERLIGDTQRAAVDYLYGMDYQTVEQLQEDAAAVTPEDLAEFAQVVRQTALFAVPGEATVRPWLGVEVPRATARIVEGRAVASIDAPVLPERLIHGPEGVGVRWPDGSHRTIRYDSLAAAVSFDDGAVHLIGNDAAVLQIEPTHWRGGHDVCREIREFVPAHLLLHHGARPAEEIPRPCTTVWQRLGAMLTPSAPVPRPWFPGSGGVQVSLEMPQGEIDEPFTLDEAEPVRRPAETRPLPRPASGTAGSRVVGWVLTALGSLGLPVSLLLLFVAVTEPAEEVLTVGETALVWLVMAVPLAISGLLLFVGVMMAKGVYGRRETSKTP